MCIPALFGIRQSKGLEFADVIIVDFFNQLPALDQKIWKQMINNSAASSNLNAPHIEMQLKLLYTAVTRARNRLIFFETKSSQAGSCFFRWMKDANFMHPFSLSNLEGTLMTSDDCIKRGIDFAVCFDPSDTVTIDSLSNHKDMLEAAGKYFVNGNSPKFSEICRLQIKFLLWKQRLSENALLSPKEELEILKFLTDCSNDKYNLFREMQVLLHRMIPMSNEQNSVLIQQLYSKYFTVK